MEQKSLLAHRKVAYTHRKVAYTHRKVTYTHRKVTHNLTHNYTKSPTQATQQTHKLPHLARNLTLYTSNPIPTPYKYVTTRGSVKENETNITISFSLMS